MSAPGAGRRGGLGSLLVDLLRFQAKLLLDAVRDVLLVPITFIAAGVDALLWPWRRPSLFYRMIQIAERSERLIDLWSIVYQRLGPPPEKIDAVLDQVEAAVRDPALGKRRARVLARWLQRRWRAQQRQHFGRNDGSPPSPQ